MQVDSALVGKGQCNPGFQLDSHLECPQNAYIGCPEFAVGYEFHVSCMLAGAKGSSWRSSAGGYPVFEFDLEDGNPQCGAGGGARRHAHIAHV